MKNIIKKTNIFLISLSLISPFNTYAYTKTETVYTTLNSNGEVKETNVNIELSKLESEDIIDYSNLENIKNVNGEEKFTKDTNKLTWKSTGKDISYKGKASLDLPISVTAKYYLNGEETKVKELNGKKGKVEIVYEFTNNSYNSNYGMYTPFIITSVTILPTKNNSNFNINNGKIISTGTNKILTGISSPGLYEDTNISELKDLNKIIISYDTDKFKLNETYFAITPKLLDEVDITKFNSLNNLNSSFNTLKSGVNELENGSKDLTEGSNTLYQGLETLNNGLKEAVTGSEKLLGGLSQINNNTKDFNSLPILVNNLYETYQNNLNLLNNINSGVTKEQLEEGIKNANYEKTNLETKLVEVESGITALEQLKENNLITEEQLQQLEVLYSQKEQIRQGIIKYQNGISDAENNLRLLPLGAAKIEGANEVISKILCALLKVETVSDITEDTINNFNNNIISLVDGINSLTEGSKNLNIGLGKLSTGSDKLMEGSKTLTSGNEKLHNGISKLNNEGINKLINYKNKINNYKNTIENLISLSKNYKGYSSNNIDKTIFIYKISK